METYGSSVKDFAFHCNLMFCQFMLKIVNFVCLIGNKVDILIFVNYIYLSSYFWPIGMM